MKKLLLTTLILFSIIKAEAQCGSFPLSVFVPTLTCASPTGTVVITTTVSPVTCIWAGPGIVSGGNTLNPVVNVGGIYAFTITNTTNGCNAIYNINVQSPLNVTSPWLSCSTTTAVMYSNPSFTPTSYFWTGPGIVSSNTTNTITVNATGYYICTISNTVTGCQVSGSGSVGSNTFVPPITINNNTITCAYPTVDLIASSTTFSPSLLNFSWQGSGIVSGATTQTITVNASGVYTCNVTNTLNGCVTSTTGSVLQNTIMPSITAGGGGIICSGQTATLTASSMSSVSYSWVPSIGLSSTTNSVVYASAISGTYTITVTDITNGCSSFASINIAVASNPTITANNATICAGTSVILTASGATSYTWFPGALTGNNITVSPTANTTYTVYGSSGTCTAATTSSVSVVQFPYTGNSATLTCSSPTVSIPLTTTVNPVSCIWANTPGLVSGGNTLSPTVNYAGMYSFTLTNTFNGCTTSGDAAVVSNTVMPSVMISSSSNSICAGQTATLTASSTGTVSYSWSPANSLNSSTNASVVASPNSNTVYTVTVTDMTNGCTATSNIFINVLSNPTLGITINSSPICIGTSVTLIANGNGTYNWNTGATTNSITITPTISTGYTVTSSGTCGTTTATMTVIVDNTCQDVWPGDANSDGIADNLDVLELGLHFTQTGTPRAATSNNWQSYFANNWSGTISNGKNLNHSDCNGDGTINNADTLAIYNNYGLTHAFKTAQTTTVNPQLTIVPDQASVAKGTWGTSSIYLADATTPINTVNGLAFTVNFDNSLIDPNSIYIDYQNSFIDVAHQNLYFRKLNFTAGKIFTATTHTVNSNVSGYGKIATLHYKILSSLTTDQVLNLGLMQANKSDALGTIMPLTAGTGTLMAIGASVGLAENSNTNLISINPNPTNGLLTITSKTELQKIEVITLTGQILMSEIPTGNNHLLHLENYANGIYFVNLYQNNHIIKREKVILNH